MNKYIIEYTDLSATRRVTFLLHQISLCVVILGLVGNWLSFRIFAGKRFKDNSFSFYMRVKMISDSIVLTYSLRLYLAFMFSPYSPNRDVTLPNELACKLEQYYVAVAQSVSIWLLVLIGMDRLLTILYPKKCDKILSKKRTRFLLVACLLIYAIIIYLPKFLFSELIVINGKEICRVREAWQAKIFYITVLVNLTTVTFFINNVLSFILIVYIYRSRSRFRTILQSKLNAIRDRKFAISSVTLNFICFACKTPLLVYIVISIYIPIEHELDEMLYFLFLLIFMIDNASSMFTNYNVNTIFQNEANSFLNYCRTASKTVNSRLSFKNNTSNTGQLKQIRLTTDPKRSSLNGYRKLSLLSNRQRGLSVSLRRRDSTAKSIQTSLASRRATNQSLTPTQIEFVIHI